ncbi:AP-5 complex subunit sigma-1-like [Tubulanus polymorphus]|uniref:AP-5 complex subunit sigma-1-like n=1 Tax=Tubulanus polymorphus TaxID=672921 RepID=UPI003DA65376
MVYAIIIHQVRPENSAILYHRHFAQEPMDNSSSRDNIIDIQKDQLKHVANAVQSEYVFRKAASGRSAESDFIKLNNEEVLPEFELGFIRLASNRPFLSEKVCFWLAAANCCFSLVLEKYENRAAAENVLKMIIKHLQESMKLLNNPMDALLKLDRIEIIVDKYLPGGQLLCMNNRVVRQFEKELDTIFKH